MKDCLIRYFLLNLLFFTLLAVPALAAVPAEADATAPSSGQEIDKGAWAPGPFKTIASHLEPSYITLGGGYDLEKSIKFSDIYYEGQIYLHFNWWEVLNKPNHVYRVYLPIRLQIRQYSTSSSPVKTPSFNPGIRLFYLNRHWVREKGFNYASFGFHHYSNGQSGPHYDPVTGQINTDNGSFSSDYVEGAVYGVSDGEERAWWPHWYRVKARAYLTGLTWEEAQTDYFETGLVEGSVLVFRHGKNNPLQLQLTVGHKLGRKYVEPGKDANFAKNFQYTAELSYKPARLLNWQDMSLYLRWDMGYDPYNIHYQEPINRFQVGLVGSLF